jgi:hypothetical protein
MRMGCFTKMQGLKSLFRAALFGCGLLIAFPQGARAEEAYTFDLAEIEKKPWHLGGYAELRPVMIIPDREAALYQLQYYKDDPTSPIVDYNARLQFEGSYEKGMGRAYFKTSTDGLYSTDSGSSGKTALYEGYGTLKPSESWKLEAGKKNLRWGKGYAWNPVNFFDRPKNPYDPELSLEGYVMATCEYVRSFDSPLKTLAITPVLFPVYDHVNEDFGRDKHMNAAVKVYVLFYDTDLDFIYASDGSRSPRYGADISRNLTTNFEIHGELAVIQRYQWQVLEPDGTVRSIQDDALSGLVGFRHLTDFDLTTILEYYHNGTGMNAQEMETYFSYIHNGYRLYKSEGTEEPLVLARGLAKGPYGSMSPMEDYLYLRLSQKEPLDILYFTPAVTVMANLNDRSFSISPEVLYTGVTNLEIRFRVGFLHGARETEYGERLSDLLFELRAGYYF